jgi:hypothetical protein
MSSKRPRLSLLVLDLVTLVPNLGNVLGQEKGAGKCAGKETHSFNCLPPGIQEKQVLKCILCCTSAEDVYSDCIDRDIREKLMGSNHGLGLRVAVPLGSSGRSTARGTMSPSSLPANEARRRLLTSSALMSHSRYSPSSFRSTSDACRVFTAPRLRIQ